MIGEDEDRGRLEEMGREGGRGRWEERMVVAGEGGVGDRERGW